MLFKAAFVVGLTVTLANAHMHMSGPAPLGSKENKYTPSGSVDYSYDSPLDASGANFPCKGKLDLLDGEGGKPVATWAAGSKQTINISGGASHNGGSCQVSLSLDRGASWKVIASFIGNCPTSNGGSLPITIPEGVKSGDALVAWTWFNKVGNREMYMNCAAISFTGGGNDNLSSYPDMFVANIGNGCSTTESVDIAFPNPGKNVQNSSQKSGPPVGNCGASGKGSDSSSGSQTSPSPSIPSSDGTGADNDSNSSSTSKDSTSPPSQNYDNGLYNPPKNTDSSQQPTATVIPEAPQNSANPNDNETDAQKDKSGASYGSSTSPTIDQTSGTVYDIVIEIDNKKMTGKATLSVPISNPQYRHRALRYRY